MTGTVNVTYDEPVCTVELLNEGRRNALSPTMIEQLRDAFETLSNRDNIRVSVITGHGDQAFCSGFDISGDFSPVEHQGILDQAMKNIVNNEYPTIAMVNGDAIGGGFELIASCDLRYSVEDARFGVPAAKVGVVYGERGIRRFLDLMGPANTKEILYKGELVDSGRAKEMGLLNEVVERDQLADQTYETAETIGSNAPLSLSGMKQIIHGLREKQSLTEWEKDVANSLVMEAYQSWDHEEGMTAFAENREPDFEGR